ncbi:hypothetical protein NSE01_16420 [Novosphingobium sediminis]|uniref:Uncharacterized protein n=1 Tax=Novosphingobium sediminis TaxID=707214 RepID=A0A512AJD4_9SPHN|nr:hypothetical protein [Novosphingobium sediminis]GEN99809.1 hypothetical protein NSE01_16420 [Novosphingobium sediminis]
MELTFIGAAQVLIGLTLFVAGSVEAMFAFALVSAMFGGSAALQLPVLGNSSIPPIQFALLFVAMRLLVPGAGQMAAVGRALRANGWLVCFVIYGVAIAFIAPRLFAGQLEVTPLRGRVEARYVSTFAYVYAVRPLMQSPQNLTTAVYLVGTLIAGIASFVACGRERGRAMLVRTLAAVGIAHALTGFASVVIRGTPAEVVLAVFRNAAYAQLDQSYNGFVRMTGLLPEASTFANYGLVLFVFSFECWLRRIDPRWTGPAAALLATALALSTSSSAYAGLPAYGAIVAVRSLLFPGALPADRALWIGGALLALVSAGCAVMIWQPHFADSFADMIRHMTIEKSETLSAQQRRFWAWQGLHAFAESGGIGIGPGSFRSSSLATAVLGCTGVIGAVTLLLHILSAFSPLRHSTWAPIEDKALSTAAACSWAMIMGVAIGSIASPTCDPGTDFAIMSGAALALRRMQASAALTVPATSPATGPAPGPIAEPPVAAHDRPAPFLLAGAEAPRGFMLPEPLVLDSALELA